MFDVNLLIKYFITWEGYKDLLNGLWATIQIAVLGLIIGTFVGTLIAVVKIVPAKSVIIKILNKV